MLDQIQQTLAKVDPFKKVVVGLSGGSDSVALAHCMKRLGYLVTLAHVNYGTRGQESERDEKFVRSLAEKWDLPLYVHKAPKVEKGNFENQARQIRYEFFESIRQKQHAKYIAVGHHQNDQLETVLMHIERGAGLRGRCGMYVCRDKVIRPLLNVDKSTILQYIKEQNLSYYQDSTNDDLTYKRNWIRHKIIPQLRQKWADFDQKIITWSEISKRRLHKNEKRAHRWIQNHVKNQRFNREAFLKLFSGVQAEVLFQLISKSDVYKKDIQQLIDLISKGQAGKKRAVQGVNFRIEYDEVCIESADYLPLTPEEVDLMSGIIKWGQWQIEYNGQEKIKVRQWRKGDRFAPTGMKGTKKLQDFFVDAKIPKAQRQQVPIITNQEGEVLSIANLRFSKEGEKIKSLLKIKKLISHEN